MVTRYQIVTATPEHITMLAPIMRKSDVEEVWASDGLSPEDALRQSLAASSTAFSGFADGKIVLMYGVAPDDAGDGIVWMLASDELEKHQTAFLRRSKAFVNCVCSCYSTLRNMVDARNETSIKWLRWLGFNIGEPEPWGPQDLPFRLAWRA